jgi:exopolysaccharide production protein ExoQ
VLFALAMSMSAGAWVATAIALVVLVVATILQQTHGKVRILLFVLAALALAAAVVLMPLIQELVLWLQTDVLGKDEGLTGRDEIWPVAREVMAARPVLGLGWGAFWHESNPDAMRIYRWAEIPQLSGFNFHNEYLDVGVQLGLVGLTLMIALMAFTALRLVTMLLAGKNPEAPVFLALFAYLVSRSGVETSLLGAGIFAMLYSICMARACFGQAVSLRPPAVAPVLPPLANPLSLPR